MNSLFELRNSLIEKGVIFSFSGKPSQAIISSIAETFEDKMLKSNVKSSVIQNIFSVFVEQIQNVMSYSIDVDKFENLNYSDIFSDSSFIAIGFDKTQEKYYVLSGNIIDINEREAISEKIEFANSMDKKELRAYYKELRRSGEDKHSKGAGLGIIEMAKRSSRPMEFSFERIDEKKLFFSLKVII